MSLRGTLGQFQALDAFVVYGSYAEAAYRLHLSERTLKRRIERMRALNNHCTTYQLAFRRGWETRPMEDAA